LIGTEKDWVGGIVRRVMKYDGQHKLKERLNGGTQWGREHKEHRSKMDILEGYDVVKQKKKLKSEKGNGIIHKRDR